MRYSAVANPLESDVVDVECTHCGVKMTSHWGSGKRVQYFRCASCHRWVSSTYADIFRADARMRHIPAASKDTSVEAFSQVKDRLERWLAAIDRQDPYQALSVTPHDSAEQARAKFRRLALARHPDRGGSEEEMRDLNSAYERLKRHRESADGVPATVAAPAALPPRRR